MVTPLDGGRSSCGRLIAWGLIASLLVAGLYLYPPFLLAYLISGSTMSCSGPRTASRRRDGS
jgi:hypothetical protein